MTAEAGHSIWTPSALYGTADGLTVTTMTLASGSLGAQDYSISEDVEGLSRLLPKRLGGKRRFAEISLRLAFQLTEPNQVDLFVVLPTELKATFQKTPAREHIGVAVAYLGGSAFEEYITYNLFDHRYGVSFSALGPVLTQPATVLSFHRVRNTAWPTAVTTAVYITSRFPIT